VRSSFWKSTVTAVVAGVVLAGCSGWVSNSCQANSGFCRTNAPDGGCVLYMPVCCEGGPPRCGDGQTPISQKIDGCQQFSSAHGIACE
jgi:hypothetical protein